MTAPTIRSQIPLAENKSILDVVNEAKVQHEEAVKAWVNANKPKNEKKKPSKEVKFRGRMLVKGSFLY